MSKITLSENKYLYNGKELQDEQLGGINLDLYDYHMRQYDPALGRFTTPDPHAESYLDFSPYHYVLDNPLNATDPDGMDVFAIAGGTRYTGIDAQNAFRQLQASSSSSNPDDPPKKDEEKISYRDIEETALSGAEKKDFSGIVGKLDYVLNAGSFDGFDYNLKGEPTGITLTTGVAPAPGIGTAKTVKIVRSTAQRAKYLKDLYRSGKAPKWMSPWLKQGKVPPGHQVDHLKALSAGGKDAPSNMRLKTTSDHRVRHKFYRPWQKKK